jgi:ATP-dependent Lon protease
MLLMLNDRLMRLQGYFMPPQEMTRFLGERFPGSGYVPLPDMEESLELEVDDSHRANHESLVGEVTGLAAGPDSGDLLDSDVMILEVEARPGRDTEVIGRAGEVLKQSVLAAWRHVQQHAVEYGVDDSRIRDTGVSVHLVNIARHREGPSAGVPFVVAMVSALSGRAVRPRMAMTGEVSLKGHVGKVGGIPQKIVAAYRNGRTNVILPRTNAADVVLVPQEIRDAMQVHLVDNVAEAIAIALEPSSHDPGATS